MRSSDANWMFASRTADYTELHYLLSWTNTSDKQRLELRYGQKFFTFTYNNYVELLNKEVELLENANYDTSVLTGEGRPYMDVRQFETVRDGQKQTFWYGLTSDHIVETIDSGSQYPFNEKSMEKTRLRSVPTRPPTDLEGFEFENSS